MAAKKKPAKGPAPKRGRGRPKVELDPKMIHDLAKIGCTQDEIADVSGCVRETLTRRLAKEEDLAAAWRSGRAEAKLSLRRAQYKYALRGNPQLLIWLGKNELNQKDTPIGIQMDNVSFLIRERMGDGTTAYFAEGEDLFDAEPDTTGPA